MENLFQKFERPLAIYAHPDDEVIGCSSLVSQMKDKVLVCYATDGMPLADESPEYYYPQTSFKYGDDYKHMRKQEAFCALRTLGMTADERVSFLNFGDGQLLGKMNELVRDLRRLFAEVAPDLIVTGAFEGGHLDHDLLTYAIWKATEGNDLVISETPLYSLRGDTIMHNTPTYRHNSWSTLQCSFSAAQIEKKTQAFDCYGSQRIDLQYFDPGAKEFYHFINRRRGHIEEFMLPANGGQIEYDSSVGHDGFIKAIRDIDS